MVLVGCSHPGLERILKKAKQFGKIWGVIGGFHDFDKFNALKEIDLVAATHCSKHRKEIRELFPKTFAECGAGKEFEFE